MYCKSVLLKLFHVKDPQIDTYQPADPHLKRYASGTPIREDFYGSSSDSQPLSFQGPPSLTCIIEATDPHLMAFLSLGPPFISMLM